MAAFPPRDMIGYGRTPPHVRWPVDARIAVSFVINYEEGAESSVLMGDGQSEHLLQEIVGIHSAVGRRLMSVESMYEYGSRAGFWRLHRLFTSRNLPVTVFACAAALELNPDAAKAMKEAEWEVSSHGYRWIDYLTVPKEVEREHIAKAVTTHIRLLGERPVGFYQGKPSVNTRCLIVKEGGFTYDNDSYADDLPYWDMNYGKPHLVIPYTLDNNDMKFAMPQGFNCGEQFYTYLKDSFDCLYEEGKDSPKMMSIGLHCRLVGRPGRMLGLVKFLDYLSTKPDIWICRRGDIASWWYENYYPTMDGGIKVEASTPRI